MKVFSPQIRAAAILLALGCWLEVLLLFGAGCRPVMRPHELAARHNNQGVVYLNRKEYEKALQEFNIAIELSPQYADAHHNLGVYYEQTGDLKRAEAAYLRAVKADFKYAQPHNGLCSVYRRQKKYDPAIKHGKKALKKDKSLADAAYCMGLVYSDQDKKEEAITSFRKATDINPNHYLAHNALGIIYLKQGNYDQAINRFKPATEINPRFEEAWRFLGFTYFQKGDYTNANGALKAALGIDPQSADAHRYLGATYLKQAQSEPLQALHYCEGAALEFNFIVKNINSHDGNAWGHHGLSLRCVGAELKRANRKAEGEMVLKRAEISLERSLREEPDFCPTYLWIGELQMEEFAQVEKGIRSIEAGLSCSEKDKTPLLPALFKLGMYYYGKGDKAKALQMLCRLEKYQGSLSLELRQKTQAAVASLGGC